MSEPDWEIVDDLIADGWEERAAIRFATNTPRGMGREGVVTVWAHDGRYLGCMGKERWKRLFAEDSRVIRKVVLGAHELWSCPCGIHLHLNSHWFRLGEPTWVRCLECGYSEQIEFEQVENE